MKKNTCACINRATDAYWRLSSLRNRARELYDATGEMKTAELQRKTFDLREGIIDCKERLQETEKKCKVKFGDIRVGTPAVESYEQAIKSISIRPPSDIKRARVELNNARSYIDGARIALLSCVKIKKIAGNSSSRR